MHRASRESALVVEFYDFVKRPQRSTPYFRNFNIPFNRDLVPYSGVRPESESIFLEVTLDAVSEILLIAESRFGALGRSGRRTPPGGVGRCGFLGSRGIPLYGSGVVSVQGRNVGPSGGSGRRLENFLLAIVVFRITHQKTAKVNPLASERTGTATTKICSVPSSYSTTD